jgi:hypothetical protein
VTPGPFHISLVRINSISLPDSERPLIFGLIQVFGKGCRSDPSLRRTWLTKNGL